MLRIIYDSNIICGIRGNYRKRPKNKSSERTIWHPTETLEYGKLLCSQMGCKNDEEVVLFIWARQKKTFNFIITKDKWEVRNPKSHGLERKFNII